MSPTKQKI